MVNPTPTDDNLLGYTVGSQWLNTCCCKLFICKDDSTTDAVWVLLNNTDSLIDEDDVIDIVTDQGFLLDKDTSIVDGNSLISATTSTNFTLKTIKAGNNITIDVTPESLKINSSATVNVITSHSFSLLPQLIQVNSTVYVPSLTFPFIYSKFGQFNNGCVVVDIETVVDAMVLVHDKSNNLDLASLNITTGSGMYELNFTLPATSTRLEFQFKRSALPNQINNDPIIQDFLLLIN